KFGGGLYKGGGSHGCINLPFYVAENIYGIVEKGTPVICYYLDGTESTSITTQDDKEIAQFVVDAIERIGSIEKGRIQTLEKTFERIRAAYATLTFNQKKYVTNFNKLEKAEKKFKELKNSL
ncbi:MAG: L,D-transpeptidase, partial [Lachnospiraceae bacterium]|nr:L,D-transpeptidase [Lachnospiraceae bacterium]